MQIMIKTEPAQMKKGVSTSVSVTARTREAECDVWASACKLSRQREQRVCVFRSMYNTELMEEDAAAANSSGRTPITYRPLSIQDADG